jgi:pyruvate dehydrogenase E2 component (dihydrolipoamide acetyltransferase)
MPVEITMPKLGLTMSEGLLARWLVQDGERVEKGQPIFEIETDKAAVEAEAPAGGVLRIGVEAGATVPVMGLVGHILAPDEELQGAALSPAPPGSRVLASPAARRIARELGVDLGRVRGSGEGGRIVVADVEAFAADGEAAATPAGELRASPLARRIARQAGLDLSRVRGTGAGGRVTREDVERALAGPEPLAPAPVPPPPGEWVPIAGVRSVIAERMLASARGTAAVTLTATVDATELVNVRDQLNEGLSDKLGRRIAYHDILIKILARALKEFPYMNAHQEEGAVRLIPEVHLGLAVDTERGLMVVVVRDADRKSIPDISRETGDKIERAASGKILPDELAGGTFTLTNLGAFGVEAFTPLINPPEVAVLGVGRIQQQPAAHKGEIVLRHRVALSLTFDHRVVDGAPAARFLARLRELIEKPYLLMVEEVGRK